MPVIVFQHSNLSVPGRLGLTLRDHGHKLDIRRLDKGDRVPPDLDGVDAVISLGGPQNLDEPRSKAPWLDDEIAYVKTAHDAMLPVVGVCLGHQILAAALGGEVGPMEKPELGFHTVTLNPSGQTDTILAGLAWDMPQFHAHGREVKTLPPGATALASSKQCRVQAFRAGIRSYGYQFHFELDRDGVAAFARHDREDFANAGLTYDDVMKQADKHYPAFARMSDRLCVNIVTMLMPLYDRSGLKRRGRMSPTSHGRAPTTITA